MKHCIAIVFFLFIGARSFATGYYVSNAGNNTFSGTRPDSAWQTIDRLNTVTFLPGDSVLFASGETFRGQWNFMGNGAVGSNIYIGVYGGSAKAVISGSVPLNNWSPVSGNLYSIQFNMPCKNLIVNGALQTPARFPNSGFLRVDSVTGNDNIYCKALPQAGNYYVGTNIHLRTSNRFYETRQVINQNGIQLLFNSTTDVAPQGGYGFYLDGKHEFVDTAGEWYNDTTTHEVFYIPNTGTDISTASLEGTVLDYGLVFDSSVTNITINNISFANQYSAGVKFVKRAGNILVFNCSFINQEMYGIYSQAQTSGSVIKNNTFQHINGTALWMNSLSGDSVSYNHFNEVGAEAGLGLSGASSCIGIFSPSITYSVISYNRFDTIGYAGINANGTGNVIERNIINHSLYTLADGGAVTMNGVANSQTVIKENFIYNTFGNTESANGNSLNADGILLDNNSSDLNIQHNTIVNSTTNGIFVGTNNQNHSIKENVIYNSGNSQIYFIDPDTLHGTSGNNVNGNVFYCLNGSQNSIIIDGQDSLFHPATLDGNYYCNPYSYFPILFKINTTNPIVDYPYNLEQWKHFYLNDINSHESLVRFKTFNLIDTLAPSIIFNGHLTNNTDGWSSYPLDNNDLLLDNSTSLDGGCLKIAYIQGSGFPFCEFASSNISIEGGKYYMFRISLFGTGPKYVQVYCKKEDLYYFQSLGFNKYYPISTQRGNYSDIFQANENYTPAQLGFKMFYFDSTLWIDNVSLQQVSVVHNDSSKLSRLLANYSSNQVTFSLGDSIYRDLDGNIVSNSTTVDPYSSRILVYDSILTSSVPALSISEQGITVFPNPINTRESLLTINTVNALTESPTISVIDMYGRIKAVTHGNIKNSNNFDIQLSEGLSAGTYIIELKTSKKVYTTRVVVTGY